LTEGSGLLPTPGFFGTLTVSNFRILLDNRCLSRQTAGRDRPLSQFKLMTTRPKVLLINGPNLNMLGTREPELYGRETLAVIESRLVERARQAGADLAVFQSNSEGDLVERIQQAGPDGVKFIIINPAAYTHTSVAMRDALAAVGIPFLEIHISNIFARETFRQRSYFSDLAVGIISGLGTQGYELAMACALRHVGRT